MNRVKKEEKRKHDEARKGLSEDQISVLDLEDLIKAKIERLALKIMSRNIQKNMILCMTVFRKQKRGQRVLIQ